jgi:catechol 2,3-dioxygenase-like lactoylglutathione lyase family enzyme
MSLSLDHVVIAVHDLDTAIQDYQELGFTVVRGGTHANRATHNALIGFLDGTYLELLAKTGETPAPSAVDFSGLLERGEGLVGFALRTDDIRADAARLQANGFAVSDRIPGERRRQDGVVVRWEVTLIDGGFAPFLIQDLTPREWRIPNDPAVTTHANRAVGLRGVEIAVRSMADAWDRYTKLFDSSSTYPAASYNAIECIVLPEAESGTSDGMHDTLFGLHIVHERTVDEPFTLERTHGVRFQHFTDANPQ